MKLKHCHFHFYCLLILFKWEIFHFSVAGPFVLEPVWDFTWGILTFTLFSFYMLLFLQPLGMVSDAIGGICSKGAKWLYICLANSLKAMWHSLELFLCCVLLLCLGEQGWQSGESTHLPPMWLGLIPGLSVICGLSLWLVLVPAPRVFLHVLWFSSLHKNQHFQIPIWLGNSGEKSHFVDSTEIPIHSSYLAVCMPCLTPIKSSP